MKKLFSLSVLLVVLFLWAGCKKNNPSEPTVPTSLPLIIMTQTQTQTQTAETSTATPVNTASITATVTLIITSTASITASCTTTHTIIVTETYTNIVTSTDTGTVTDTATITATSTDIGTATVTATITPIPTAVHPFVAQMGSSGTADNQFQYVLGMCHDESDNLYIADSNAKSIKVYDSSNVFQGVWSVVIGTAEGEFQYPDGICYDGSQYLYVIDGVRYKVMKFTKAGVFVSEFGSIAEWGGSPNDIVYTGGYLYICFDYMIKKYTTAGIFVADIGAYGTGPGGLNHTVSVFVDSSDNIYAGSVARGVIVKFDSAGNFLTEWAHGWPGDIIMDNAGNLLVPSSASSYVRIYTTAGTYLTQFGGYDGTSIGNGLFQSPRALSIDSIGNIFVADTSTDFVQKFSK